jgi:hypothetical protein
MILQVVLDVTCRYSWDDPPSSSWEKDEMPLCRMTEAMDDPDSELRISGNPLRPQSTQNHMAWINAPPAKQPLAGVILRCKNQINLSS